MGCAVSCMQQTTMLLFGKNSSGAGDSRARLDRKLYLAKESPEPDFDLSDCDLRHVPSGIYSICKVYRKEYLYLQANKLQSLDDGGLLLDLYLIKVLNISCNKLSKLPNDIKYLVNLTELHVCNNNLEFLPDGVQYLQNLKILDISNNRLKMLTPLLGKLKRLRQLDITNNKDLIELCPELCLATNIISIELDSESFVFPPAHIVSMGTEEIMRFLCKKLNVEYSSPLPMDSDLLSSVQSPNSIVDPFVKNNPKTWEQQEAAFVEQENRYHEAAKQQREKFLSKVLQDQQELDSEIAKVHGAKEIERQKLIRAIQEDEKEIECLVTNFIQSEFLKPEILQQQLAYEQAEHDRILDIARQNYDNIKKADVLKAMELLIEEDYSIQHSKKHYEDSLSTVKQSMLLQELEGVEKMEELLKAKDQSRTVLVEQLLEDQDVQKAIVGSLMEKTDAKTWSLNEEISLISSHLARLSTIEQEKKRLQMDYNYNELLHQRVQMINLLDDLLDQQAKRRKQLLETLKEMDNETDKSTDFWLKNYQKLMDSAPRTLLDYGKHLDPIFANYLLQEGVIHCLPFLVKFFFSGNSLLDVTHENLKESGISLSADREGILRAISDYVGTKNKESVDEPDAPAPSAPSEPDLTAQNFTGIVTASDGECTMYESECVICMDAKCEVVFVPCGHMCCCLQCSKKEIDNCPLCRNDIDRIIQVRIA